MAEEGDGKALAVVTPPPDSMMPAEPAGLAAPSTPSAPSPGMMRSERSISSVQVRASFGFMTDPQSLAEYERHCPGSADLIIRQSFEQAGRQQAHRHQQENEALQAEIRDNHATIAQGTRAQWLGAALTAALIGLAFYLAKLQHAAEALGVVTVACSSVIATFIYGRKKQSEEVKAMASDKSQQPGGGAIAASSVDDTSG